MALEKQKEIDKKYPISEIFTSPQGEGVYTGQLQTFIRLAGCTVGKPYPKEYKSKLPIYTEQCTLYDGRQFACDTDYRVHKRLTVDEIMLKIPADVNDICITGGEPLMHDLSELVSRLWQKNHSIHIETSGTKDIKVSLGESYEWAQPDLWVTISPKFHPLESMIMEANELKLLVDEHFDPERPIACVGDGYKLIDIMLNEIRVPIYIQPVNGENDINGENLSRCLEWQRKFPNLRISLQLHKAMGKFIGELVR